MLDSSSILLNDQLNTFCEHIAIQVSKASFTNENLKMLITGGGAFNEYLMERIRHHMPHFIIQPDDNTINFKEALIFAFLGVLRWRQETNCLQSVTGARQDNIGGAIYFI
jgi:anhydro-N-acetylmuramic acid kinase